MKEDDVVQALWREDEEEVRSAYSDILSRRISDAWRLNGYHRRLEERARRKLPSRRKIGLTLNEIASRTNIRHATLVSLLEHHGILEMAQYGLDQRRRMVTEDAFKAELGHNVIPANRIGHLEGHQKACPFPVLYPDRLSDILWMLDYDGIKREVGRLLSKKKRLAFLLVSHPYLPDQEIASLAGYSRSAVIRARQRSQPKPILRAASFPPGLSP